MPVPASQPEPRVSIVIPVKNGLPHFRKVIAMIVAQKVDFAFEVIVIDSGSKDGSISAVPADDPRFRFVQIPPEDFGHGRTRNLGVEMARGEFCALLTHDAIPADENWLAELVRPLREDAEVAAVFGRHVAHEGASPFTIWELETHFQGLRNWPVVWISDAREYVQNQGLRQIYHFYSDNSSCLRRSVWERFPYPDVSFAEDQLWVKKILEAGYKKAFAWDSVVHHSHEYSIRERLMRSYDESKAFFVLFGYRLCPSRKEVIRQTVRTTARDWQLAIRRGWMFYSPVETVKRPFDNLARQIGYYLGASGNSTVKRHERLFSRDQYLRNR